MKIALVPIVAHIDGQCTVIAAGAEIPDCISDRDTQALLAAGALRDDGAAPKAKAPQDDANKADAQSQAARQEAADSTQPGAAEPPKAPATPVKAKK